MVLQALSLGCEVDVWRPQNGVVHSAFYHAANLLIDGEMWTVLGGERHDAPFGIRLAPHGCPQRFQAQPGDDVRIRAGYVSVGRMIVDCRTASRWAPTRWVQPASGLAIRLSIIEKVARPRAWAESATVAADVTETLGRSGSHLADAVRRTAGRGPGLTPAGDDVLAGIFALFTSGAAGSEGVRATARLTDALTPVLPTIPDVSRHLLGQAARGLPGRALHDFGQALIEGAPQNILINFLERLLDTGFTSGADACMGLTAACRFSFPNAERLAA